MNIIAKGEKGTGTLIEINDEMLIFKQFFIKKKFVLEKYIFEIVKYKQCGKIFSGSITIEVLEKEKRKKIYKFTVQYDKMEQNNFDKLVECINEINNRKLYENCDKGIIYVAEGVDGVIELYENRIKIKRDSNSMLQFAIHGLKGNKEIWLKHIIAIQLKEPGTINGYIQFTIPGGNESKGGIIEAAGDENTIIFSSSQLHNFKKLKELIYEYIDKNNIDNDKSNKTESNENNIEEITKTIEKLSELRKNEIITEDEFNKKKIELLNRI